MYGMAGCERALIGAALLDVDQLAREAVFQTIQADDFFFTAHSIIWQAIERLRGSGTPVGVLTVTAEFAQMGVLDRMDELTKPEYTEAYLTGCWADSLSSIGAGAWARIIHDYADRRRAIDNAGKTVRDAYAGKTRNTGRGGIAL